MAVIQPWAMDAVDGLPEYDGQTLRAIASATLAAGDTPTRARPGVLSGLDVVVDGDAVYVGSGLCVVATPEGSFTTGLDTEEVHQLDAQHPTNPRIDRLVMRIVHEPVERGARVEVITGDPAPNPSAPSTPENAESLGTISVPEDGGGGAVFNDSRRYTAARGGIVPARSIAARNRMDEGTPDEPAYVTVQGVLYASTGSGWRPTAPFGVASGSVSITGVGDETSEVEVNFPSGRFTQAPFVFATSLASSLYLAVPASVSTSGCRIIARSVYGYEWTATRPFFWHAVQMTPTDAAG